MVDLSKDLYGLINSNLKDKIVGVSNDKERLIRYSKTDPKYTVWRLVLISGELPEDLSP